MAKNAKNGTKANGNGSKKDGLLKPQVETLRVLAKLKGNGFLTRNEIAERAGYKSSVAIYQTAGWPDAERRKAWETETGRKSLLTLKLVEPVEGEREEGHKEKGLRITAAGRKALAALKS